MNLPWPFTLLICEKWTEDWEATRSCAVQIVESKDKKIKFGQKVRRSYRGACQCSGQRAGFGHGKSGHTGGRLGRAWEAQREQEWAKETYLLQVAETVRWRDRQKIHPQRRKWHCRPRGLGWRAMSRFWQQREERAIWEEGQGETAWGECAETESLGAEEEGGEQERRPRKGFA